MLRVLLERVVLHAAQAVRRSAFDAGKLVGKETVSESVQKWFFELTFGPSLSSTSLGMRELSPSAI